MVQVFRVKTSSEATPQTSAARVAFPKSGDFGDATLSLCVTFLVYRFFTAAAISASAARSSGETLPIPKIPPEACAILSQ